MVSTYENQFLDEQTGPGAFTDFSQGRNSVNLTAKRSLFASAPPVVRWTFSEAVQIDDTGSEMKVYTDLNNPTVYPMGGVFTVPANTPVERAFAVPNDPDSSTATYGLGIMVRAIPQGTIKVEAGGKTLVYTNIKVANYNSTPAVVPFLRLNTTNHKITSLQYKWMTRNADNTAWVLATPRLTQLFVGKDGGYFSTYVVDGTTRLQRRLELAIKPDVMENTIPFDDAHVCRGDVATEQPGGCSGEDQGVKVRVTGFPTLQDAYDQQILIAPDPGQLTWDWNNFTFVDKLGMGISVN